MWALGLNILCALNKFWEHLAWGPGPPFFNLLQNAPGLEANVWVYFASDINSPHIKKQEY